MARRARDGGLYFADGSVAGACVVLVRYGVIDSDKAQVLGLAWAWFMEMPMNARALYTRCLRIARMRAAKRSHSAAAKAYCPVRAIAVAA